MAPAVATGVVQQVKALIVAATNDGPGESELAEALATMRARLRGLIDVPDTTAAANAIRPLHDLLWPYAAQAGLDNEQFSDLDKLMVGLVAILLLHRGLTRSRRSFPAMRQVVHRRAPQLTCLLILRQVKSSKIQRRQLPPATASRSTESQSRNLSLYPS